MADQTNTAATISNNSPWMRVCLACSTFFPPWNSEICLWSLFGKTRILYKWISYGEGAERVCVEKNIDKRNNSFSNVWWKRRSFSGYRSCCGSSEKRGVSSMDRETFLIFNEDANVYSYLMIWWYNETCTAKCRVGSGHSLNERGWCWWWRSPMRWRSWLRLRHSSSRWLPYPKTKSNPPC